MNLLFWDCLFIKKFGNIDLAWNAFSMPFSKDMWLCLILVIIVTSISMLLINKMWTCNYGTQFTTRFDAILQPSGAFCYQGTVQYY